jgi:tryptophan synthase alpha chain
MNRIDETFKRLQSQNKKAFIAFITAGDPDLKTTADLVVAFESAGVDIIELGIPFSDPMADGATIQAASARAIAKGVTLTKVFETVKQIRQKTQIPIAFMTYYNPVFNYGDEGFIKACASVGVDGVIIPDLPPEEATVLRKAAQKYNISTVFFIAPTTTDERMKANAKASTGFIYYVSLTGVTGVQQAVADMVIKDIKRAKKFSNKPICAGFGITNATQVKAIGQIADGVIVGSAIIKEIEKNAGQKNLVDNVSIYVKSLTKAL